MQLSLLLIAIALSANAVAEASFSELLTEAAIERTTFDIQYDDSVITIF
ncbi:hypothetical protein [Vibrio rotiferianus]